MFINRLISNLQVNQPSHIIVMYQYTHTQSLINNIIFAMSIQVYRVIKHLHQPLAWASFHQIHIEVIISMPIEYWSSFYRWPFIVRSLLRRMNRAAIEHIIHLPASSSFSERALSVNELSCWILWSYCSIYVIWSDPSSAISSCSINTMMSPWCVWNSIVFMNQLFPSPVPRAIAVSTTYFSF